MSQIIETISSWILFLISHGSYFAILILMAVESACIPLPSEIIMPFAGYLASKGVLSIWLAAAAGALGCNVGSTLAYILGARGGRVAVERWGRFVLLSTEDLDKSERFFRKFGIAAVFIGRLLPVVRTFIAVPAGVARMSMWPFQIYTFAGSFIWCLALAHIGQLLGEEWDKNPGVKSAFHSADLLIGVSVLLAVVWFVWRRLRRSRKRVADSNLEDAP